MTGVEIRPSVGIATRNRRNVRFATRAGLKPAALAWNFCTTWNVLTCYACFLSV